MTISKVYTIKQVAEDLHVTPATVNRWISNGELKAQKLGKSWRIQEEDLKAFIEGSFESVSNDLVSALNQGLFAIPDKEVGDVQEFFKSLILPLAGIQFPLKLELDESLSLREKLIQLKEEENKLVSARKAVWQLLENYASMMDILGDGLYEIDKKREIVLKAQKRGLRSSRSNTKNVNRAKKGGAK